ncbi:MAG TPA: hypothetical protein VMJ93_06315 [Verrucomicrobiae bacterium]|nr:hypothetical protein [Verrucomicrobiae bacterium]
MHKSKSTPWAVLAIALFLAGCSGSSKSQNSASNTAGEPGNAPAAQNNPAPQPPPPPPPIVVPAGTVLTVTLDQAISTKTNSSGDAFVASLAAPVTVAGQTAIPQGAHATGTITQAQSAGRIKGGAMLALTLDSVTVNGQKYQVQSSSYEEEGKGRGKRTGIGAGGGAAFGAIVGALAGGGKGAAIGALAGGGAGTAGAAFTGQRDFTLPAETRLHFRLTQPLTINQQ